MTVSTLVFATLTHVNIRDDNLFLPARLQNALARHWPPTSTLSLW
ncbi:hypothetical protein QLQ12_08920 [Actinoplanes sp. NEAU-A12]|uniref:Uncharacterized protein n=1 Tax=Actinoplanes sandaracinus TaxID=3045177 RepID=A0ABT6WG73_9ACTN|nr:hypothetical protein [Actinoplanes sandaracinus]MDI6098721.1 hypothetical protein [Actinoplanes sandaracinus]